MCQSADAGGHNRGHIVVEIAVTGGTLHKDGRWFDYCYSSIFWTTEKVGLSSKGSNTH